ncbi:ATP-dependent zinc metalloprotease FtsH [compost metagenome]
MIDHEVRLIIEGVYTRTKDLLTEKREGLEKLAQKLIEKEILFQADLEEILGKRPFDNRTTYDEFVNGTGDQKPAAEGLVHDGVSPADPATPINPAQTES